MCDEHQFSKHLQIESSKLLGYKCLSGLFMSFTHPVPMNFLPAPLINESFHYPASLLKVKKGLVSGVGDVVGEIISSTWNIAVDIKLIGVIKIDNLPCP